jgi:molecular chaperone IbpA
MLIDLAIETKGNRLAIRGRKQTSAEEKTADVLYQGIAARTFERSFQLADDVKVKGAILQDGLLNVDLVRDSEGDEASLDPDRKLPSKVLEVNPTKVAALNISL